MSRGAMNTALKRLMTEYKQLTAAEDEDSMFTAGPVSEDDFFTWSCLISGPEDTPFEGGVFQAELKFPRDYPLSPPKMRFDPPLFHPNIYANGEVCISILHAPGDDPNSYESASERWSPVQSVEKILLSVISMLAEPNLESGANIDACKLYRDNREEYDESIRAHVRQQLDLPALPTVSTPLELSPFEFLPVLPHVFAGPNAHPTSNAASSTSSPPVSPRATASGSTNPTRSVLGSLVSSVVESVQGATASATAAGAGGARTIRTVAANDDTVWVATNVGGAKVFRVARPPGPDDDGATRPATTSTGRFASPPRTPSAKRSRGAPVHEVSSSLELVEDILEPLTTSKKPIDRLTVLPRLENKAVILSDGVLTFHAISSRVPTLTPLNVHQFPAIRGVVTYSLDQDELRPAKRGGPQRRKGRGGVQEQQRQQQQQQLLVIKKRSLHWIRISNEPPSANHHSSSATVTTTTTGEGGGGGGGGQTAITTIKQLPLPDGATIAVLRNHKVCIADGENYSIVDLDAAEAWPLLPISQAPNTDPFPSSITSSSSPPVVSPASSPTKPRTTATSGSGGLDADRNSGTSVGLAVAAEQQQQQQPPGGGGGGDGPDPRQLAAIACVGAREFLVASHTGPTTLGVFVNDLGEPCRGTLEWSHNLRDLAIDERGRRRPGGDSDDDGDDDHERRKGTPREGEGDDDDGEGGYSIALLWNATIEVHGLSSQELRQVVNLATLAPGLTGAGDFYLAQRGSGSSSAASWRGLLNVAGGIDLGNDHKTRVVQVPLLGGSGRGRETTSSAGAPSTPTKGPRVHRDKVTGADRDHRQTLTKTLVVVGKDSLYALVPLTVFVRADNLINQGKVGECLELVRGSAPSFTLSELSYIYLRLAYLSLVETDFESSFDHFLQSRCDPRIVVKLFSNLLSSPGAEARGGGVDELIGKEDTVQVVNGVVELVENRKTIEGYIVDNLNHNYSPHLQPSVETANPTIQLRTHLIETAKDRLLSYLLKWRVARREGDGEVDRGGIGGRRTNDSRKIDIVVDTTLVSLLAASHRPEDIKVLLASRNDCVLARTEQPLLDAGLYDLVAELALKAGRTEKVLDIWTKIVEGEYYSPASSSDTDSDRTRRVFELVSKSKDRDLVEKYGLWLLKYDKPLGLKLFIDPRQKMTFDPRQLFGKMRLVDTDAADQYLEGTVLSQDKDTDSALHVELVKRYLTRLGELLGESHEAKSRLRQQETVFAQRQALAPTSGPRAESFLSFLTSQYSSSQSPVESVFARLDRVRLKTILFLSTSSKYDVQDAKRQLEDMEMSGLRGLTLERVIVYGKLKLDRQALALLVHTLRDLSSAETYSLQVGHPLVPSDLAVLASKLELPVKRDGLNRKHRHGTSGKREEEEAKRRHELARVLIEMCLATTTTTTGTPAHRASAEEEEKGNENDLNAAIGQDRVANLLKTQATNLDTIEVLTKMPDSFPLNLLDEFLARSLRRSLHVQQEGSILKNLASGQNLVVSERLFEMQAKRGGVVDSGRGDRGFGARDGEKVDATRGEKKIDEGDRTETGGEKEVRVVPSSAGMSLEDAVELDLR